MVDGQQGGGCGARESGNFPVQGIEHPQPIEKRRAQAGCS